MHEREHDHAQATSDPATHDSDLAPGHSNRAAQLIAPTRPLVSGLLQRKSRDANGVTADAEQAVASASSSSGDSLPGPIMRKFESSLGTDLSSVRVHTGAESQAAATSVGARAYTIGQDIHFGAGQYDPSSSTGQHLLAHEVAHTVQQRGGMPTRQNKLEVSTPQSSAEIEADRAADAMLRGDQAFVGNAGPGSIGVLREADAGDPEGAVSIQPPQAISWGAIGASPASPSTKWGSVPQFRLEYNNAPNLNPYKSAFTTSWQEAQLSYNNIYAMNETIRQDEKALPPALFRVSADAKVGAEGAGKLGSDAFKGDKLKTGVDKIDSAKVPEAVRIKILDLRDNAIPAADANVANKATDISNTKDMCTKAENSLTSAQNSLKITYNDADITQAGLNKDQVKRDLEDYKANIKATVDSVKAVTSIVSVFTDPDPSKKVGNILKAVDAGASAVGSISEAGAVHEANSKLQALDGKLAKLNTSNAGLKATNAGLVIENAKLDIAIAKRAIDTALRNYTTACKARNMLYVQLAAEMKKAGEGSGMSKANQQLLAAAVEIIPKLQTIVDFIKGLKGNAQPPPYSEESGIGAAMTSNFGEFSAHVAIVKGNDANLADLNAIWEGRLTSVQALLSSATAMPGADW